MKLIRRLKNVIETNQVVSNLFDLVASTKLYRSLIYSRIEKVTQYIKKNKQYNVIIETTNFCNARCIMCPHTIMKRPQKTMNQEIFNKIVERLTTEQICPNAFILNGFGEPLIDPKIIDRIKILKEKFPYSKIKFYSNLNLATKKMIDGIIKSNLDEINISLNGYSSRSYQKVMKIDYQKTIQNLKLLIKSKKQQHSKLKIRISMTLVKNNESSVEKFIKKWSKQVDSVSVNKVHNYHGNVEDRSHKFKINFQKKPFPCRYLWDTITIDVNGNIVLCCLDYESQHIFGNVISKPILKSFYSQKLSSIRQFHLESKTKNIDICHSCYTPYKNGVEWLITKLY